MKTMLSTVHAARMIMALGLGVSLGVALAAALSIVTSTQSLASAALLLGL